MNKRALILFLFTAVFSAVPSAISGEAINYGLVIHGGAGTHPPDLEPQYRAGLNAALDAGYAVLEKGGSSIDAVVAAIKVMEDDPTFNAGRGAVLNSEGFCELDAAIMDGKTLGAGAVAGVQHVKNPITLALDVMRRSKHVLLMGAGADQFASSLGYEWMPAGYFQTERRKKALQKNKGKMSDGASASRDERIWGTVGCVALDQQGNLAAGTSTGGLGNKKFGRVGDSPIIGAGTYADNATCAVSATGKGEFFIRAVASHDIAARVAYRGTPLATAADEVLARVKELGGTGGFIALNRSGEVAMSYNTSDMCRGCRMSDGTHKVLIFEGKDQQSAAPGQ